MPPGPGAEGINIVANGNRALFTRNVANVVIDLNDTESIDFNALGGADTITIGDLSGTDVTEINLNLAGANGAGDGQADTIVIDGTSGDDVVLVFGDNGGVSVLGLSARVNITGCEAGLDRLVVRTLAGDDVLLGGPESPGPGDGGRRIDPPRCGGLAPDRG